MNKGGFDSKASGTRGRPRHFPFPSTGSWCRGTSRRLAGRQPLPSSPRGRPAQPRHPARTGPLRATPAERQFDISRPARARLEPKHVPGCFIAAAAAAEPRGCVCARPGGREAWGGGGGRRSAGAGSWSPGEAKKVNSSCCARAWENPAPCAWPGLIGARCVWGVCVSGGPLLRPPPGQESEGVAGWEPSSGAYHHTPRLPPAKVSPSGRRAHTLGWRAGNDSNPPLHP